MTRAEYPEAATLKVIPKTLQAYLPAGQMKESFEEMSMAFATEEKLSAVLKPVDRAFDLPVFEITKESSTVLTSWLLLSHT